jgi:hypothetical protein
VTAKTIRLNLADAVNDLAPAPPPCFHNRIHWLEYLQSAAAAQACRTEPKVILSSSEQGAHFNLDFNFCADCTQVKSVQMMAKGLCNPNHLTQLKKEDAE